MARLALDELHAQIGLELAHLLGEGWLAHMAALGGAAKMLKFSDGLNIF